MEKEEKGSGQKDVQLHYRHLAVSARVLELVPYFQRRWEEERGRGERREGKIFERGKRGASTPKIVSASFAVNETPSRIRRPRDSI